MPLRAHPEQQGAMTLLCINCPESLLNIPLSRYTLKPDKGFAQAAPISLFTAICGTCGYTADASPCL
ncbi:hypothetical protein [Corallococcus sp. RDP092CA]|uniref:hypothetical protein n=1 Tax=Corallococcus sp. RDP092CA TaxID=3109369 RepID=UPI0035B3B7C0